MLTLFPHCHNFSLGIQASILLSLEQESTKFLCKYFIGGQPSSSKFWKFNRFLGMKSTLFAPLPRPVSLGNEFKGSKLIVNQAVTVKTTNPVKITNFFRNQIFSATLCNWKIKQFFRWFENQCVFKVFSLNSQILQYTIIISKTVKFKNKISIFVQNSTSLNQSVWVENFNLKKLLNKHFEAEQNLQIFFSRIWTVSSVTAI